MSGRAARASKARKRRYQSTLESLAWLPAEQGPFIGPFSLSRVVMIDYGKGTIDARLYVSEPASTPEGA